MAAQTEQGASRGAAGGPYGHGPDEGAARLDDGTSLWVYWETLRRGAWVSWCERLSLAFPDTTVRLQFLYEIDYGSRRYCWLAGEMTEYLDLNTDETVVEAVINQFYDLVARTHDE